MKAKGSSVVCGGGFQPPIPSIAQLELPWANSPPSPQEVVPRQRVEPELGAIQARLPQLASIFHDFTGLRLQTLGPGLATAENAPPKGMLCPVARALRAAGEHLPGRCKACLDRQWCSAKLAGGPERVFRGACGVTTVCASLDVPRVGKLRLLFQAFITEAIERASRMGSAPSCAPKWIVRRRAGLEMDAQAFLRAESLLGVMLKGLAAELRAQSLEQKLRAARIPERPAGAAQGQPGFMSFLAEAQPRNGAGVNLSRLHKVVADMCEFVQQHYHRPISLKELAAHLDMHPNYLSDLFRKSMGVAFHTYLERKRLQHAKQLLRDPGVAIGRVARSVGYGTPNHFRKVFRAREGVSPSEWILTAQA